MKNTLFFVTGLALSGLLLATQCAPAQTATLGTFNLLEGPAAGTDSVVLAATHSWTASPNASWLHLSAPNQSGAGSTNVVFTFDANPGATRNGTLTVAGQTLTITQAGATYAAANPVAKFPYTPVFNSFASDRTGNLYILDSRNKAIDQWSAASGTLTMLVATGLVQAHGVAVDGAGNVYIADQKNNAIHEWSAFNNQLTTLISSGLNNPYGVAVDAAGNVYIADLNNDAIKKWTAATKTLTTLVGSGLSAPDGVAVDAAGNVYIADLNGIEEWVAASGTLTTLVSSGLSYPTAVAVDGAGNVYIADPNNSAIKKWSVVPGTLTTLISSGLNYPSNVAVDGAGDVYLGDAAEHFIGEMARAFVDSSAQTVQTTAGSATLPIVLPATENLTGLFAPTSDSSWLTITGVKQGVVSFAFTAYSGTSRSANLNLLGNNVVINQVGYATLLGTNSLFEPPTAGSDQVALTIPTLAGLWTATANATWLHLSPADESGTGNATVGFTFDANPGLPRTGTLTIAGQTLTVNQTGIAITAYEGFNYASGPLAGNNGGTGWTSAWINDYSSGGGLYVSSTGLAYPDDNATGGSAIWAQGNNQISEDSRQLPLVNWGVVYIQFLCQFGTGSGGGTPTIRLYFNGDHGGGFGGNGGPYGTDVSILDASLQPAADGSSSTTASLSDLNLVVARIDYDHTNTTMWVNPDLGSFNYANPPKPDATYAGLAPAFNMIAIYTRYPATVDELIFVRANSLKLTGGLLPGGNIQLGLTGQPGGSYTVLFSTNAALPPSAWTVAGKSIESAPGQFQFTATPAPGSPAGYYRVTSP